MFSIGIGRGINYWDTKNYCKNYRGGGYTDWRMPTQNEVAEIYDKHLENPDGYQIVKFFNVTACCLWASEITDGSLAAYFDFSKGNRSWDDQHLSFNLRVLPVRNRR